MTTNDLLRTKLQELTDHELNRLYESTILLQTELAAFKKYASYSLPLFQPEKDEMFQEEKSLNLLRLSEVTNLSPRQLQDRLLGLGRRQSLKDEYEEEDDRYHGKEQSNKLSLADKLKLVTKLGEIVDLRSTVSPLSTQIEQLECEIETQKEYVSFVVGNVKNESIAPESWRKHFEAETKRKDLLVERMRLQKAQLAKDLKKMRQLMEDSAGGGLQQRNLSLVDFEQLNIENQQYQQSIQELNNQLRDVKFSNASMVGKLNDLKTNLQAQLQTQAKLEREHQSKSPMAEKLSMEIDSIKKEILVLQESNKSLRDQMESYEVPEIGSYIECCQKIRQLSQVKDRYERKLQISVQKKSSKEKE